MTVVEWQQTLMESLRADEEEGFYGGDGCGLTMVYGGYRWLIGVCLNCSSWWMMGKWSETVDSGGRRFLGVVSDG